MKRIRIKWADIINNESNQNENQENHNHKQNKPLTSNSHIFDSYHPPPKYPPIRDNLQEQVNEILQRRRNRSQTSLSSSIKEPLSSSINSLSFYEKKNDNKMLNHNQPMKISSSIKNSVEFSSIKPEIINSKESDESQPKVRQLVQKMKYYQPPPF